MSALVDAARLYMDAPFRHRGRKPSGMDCAGLVMLAAADCGVELPDFRLYGREPHNDGLLAYVSAALGDPVHVAPVRLADMQAGDVGLVRYETNPHHIVIIAERDYGSALHKTFLHADGAAGRVVEQRITPDMLVRVTHLFRRPF